MRRTMCGSRRWPLPLAPIGSAATARTKRPTSAGAADGIDIADIVRMAEAAALARDLIIAVNDMGPEELAQAAQALATRFGATFNCIVGDELVKQNFR